MTAPTPGPLRDDEPLQVSWETGLLLRASQVLDAMWYARYHGGTSSGKQGNARWVALRNVANDIAKWRNVNGFVPTEARSADMRMERLRRAAAQKAREEGK